MWAPEVQQHLIFPNTGDLAADLKTEIKSVSDLSNDPNLRAVVSALVAEGQHDQALATQLLERIFRPRIEAVKERLRVAQEDGQLAAVMTWILPSTCSTAGFITDTSSVWRPSVTSTPMRSSMPSSLASDDTNFDQCGLLNLARRSGCRKPVLANGNLTFSST